MDPILHSASTEPTTSAYVAAAHFPQPHNPHHVAEPRPPSFGDGATPPRTTHLHTPSFSDDQPSPRAENNQQSPQFRNLPPSGAVFDQRASNLEGKERITHDPSHHSDSTAKRQDSSAPPAMNRQVAESHFSAHIWSLLPKLESCQRVHLAAEKLFHSLQFGSLMDFLLAINEAINDVSRTLDSYRTYVYLNVSERTILLCFSHFAAAVFSSPVDYVTKTCVLCMFNALLKIEKFSNFHVSTRESMFAFLAPKMSLAVKSISEAPFETLQPFREVCIRIRNRSGAASSVSFDKAWKLLSLSKTLAFTTDVLTFVTYLSRIHFLLGEDFGLRHAM
jgi:hypothetical protein